MNGDYHCIDQIVIDAWLLWSSLSSRQVNASLVVVLQVSYTGEDGSHQDVFNLAFGSLLNFIPADPMPGGAVETDVSDK